MKQLMIYIIENVCCGFIDNVDSGFSNSLGLNEINAYGSFLIIQGLIYSIYSLGKYTYRVKQDNAKECFKISIVIGIISGIISIVFSCITRYIFSISVIQQEILRKLLIVYGLMVPAYSIGDFLAEYLTLKTKNKELIVTSIIYYIMLIGTDIIVVKLHADVCWLVACTGICYIIYDIIVYKISGISSESSTRISRDGYIELLKHGIDIVGARLFGKLGVVVYSSYASRLGNEIYAIHNICYTCGVFTENFTNGLYTYQIVKLKQVKGEYGDRWKKCISIMKKYGIAVLVAGYIGGLLMVIPLKGALSIYDCLQWLLVYCMEPFVLVMYESYQGYLTSEEETKYLAYGGIAGLVFRVSYVIIGYSIYPGIWIFASAVTLDYAVRGIYLRYKAKMIYKLRKGELISNGS